MVADDSPEYEPGGRLAISYPLFAPDFLSWSLCLLVAGLKHSQPRTRVGARQTDGGGLDRMRKRHSSPRCSHDRFPADEDPSKAAVLPVGVPRLERSFGVLRGRVHISPWRAR